MASAAEKRKISVQQEQDQEQEEMAQFSALEDGVLDTAASSQHNDIVSRRKEKKRRKEIIKLQNAKPQFKLNLDNLLLKRKNLLKVKDWQNLILWLLADGQSTPWIMCTDRQNVTQVVVVMLQGLLPQDVFAEWNNAQARQRIIAANGAQEQPLMPAPVSVDTVAISSQSSSSGPQKFKLASPASKFMPSPPSNSSSSSVKLPDASPLKYCMDNVFQHAVVTMGPGDKTRVHSPVGSLLECQMSAQQKKERAANLVRQNGKPYDLCLTAVQMQDQLYPMYSADEMPRGWISSADSLATFGDYTTGTTAATDKHAAMQEGGFTVVASGGKKKNSNKLVTGDAAVADFVSKHRILAIDCEMSYTATGLAMTRISVVNASKKVLVDTYVVPDEPITDYNTRWSGVTAELLAGCTTTLRDVQQMLCGRGGIMDSHTILVGHSLENDLQAMKLVHHRIIDTSVIYHSQRGPPHKPSLRYLAEKYLQRQIQQHDATAPLNEQGHDSIIDAVACVDLLLLKVKNGPQFGVVEQDSETLYQRLHSAADTPASTAVKKLQGDGELLGTCIIDTQKIVGVYGEGATTRHASRSDEETIAKLLEVVREQAPLRSDVDLVGECPKHQFIYAKLKSVHAAMESDYMRKVKQDAADALALARTEEEEGELEVPHDDEFIALDAGQTREEALATTCQQLRTVYDAMPGSSVMIVLSGLGDSNAAHTIIGKRNHYNSLVKQYGVQRVHTEMQEHVFTEQHVQELEIECQIGRLGVGLFALKP